MFCISILNTTLLYVTQRPHFICLEYLWGLRTENLNFFHNQDEKGILLFQNYFFKHSTPTQSFEVTELVSTAEKHLCKMRNLSYTCIYLKSECQKTKLICCQLLSMIPKFFFYYNKTFYNKGLDYEADTLNVCKLAVLHDKSTSQIKQASTAIITTNLTRVI